MASLPQSLPGSSFHLQVQRPGDDEGSNLLSNHLDSGFSKPAGYWGSRVKGQRAFTNTIT